MTPRHLSRLISLMPLALALVAGSASAQNLRCGNTYADRGDSKMDVLTKCGEPALRDSACRPPDPPTFDDGKLRRCIDVETWAYRPGRGQFITMLDFEQGQLARIRYGDRIP